MGKIHRQTVKAGLLLVGGGVALSVIAATVSAQNTATSGGTEFRFGLSSTLRHDSNKTLSRTQPEERYEWVNGLSFGVSRTTSRDVLEFTLSTDLTAEDSSTSGSDLSFAQPNALIFYERSAAASRLTFHARYNEDDIDNLVSLLDPISGEIITESDSGSRGAFNTGLSLSFGDQSPVEGAFSIERSGVRYKDTLTSSLSDIDRWTAEAKLTAALSRVLAFETTVQRKSFHEKSTVPTDRTTDLLQLGLTYDISPILSLTSAVGYTTVDQTGASTLQKQEGETFVLQLDRQIPLGSWGMGVDRVISSNGPRDRIYLTGDVDWRLHSFDGQIGLNRGEDTETTFVAQVDYGYKLPRGELTLNAARRVSVDSDGFDEITTQVQASWSKRINTLSEIGLLANFSAVDFDDPTSINTKRSTLTASYGHALTQDWRLNTGLQYQHDKRDGENSASSNALFLTLSRDFTFRP